MTNLRIFVASPGDVEEERDIVSQIVVPEVKRIFSEGIFNNNDNGVIDIEAVCWETHVIPDVGEDAQDVVNQQIGEFDILVGMMWKRFGTPTKRSSSGTGEEFNRAYNLYKRYKRPLIMFYFRTTPFFTTETKELTQFRKVLNFRKMLKDLGVVFSEYTSPVEFERKIRENLIRQISKIVHFGRFSVISNLDTDEVQINSNTGISTKPKQHEKMALSQEKKDIEKISSRKPNIFFAYMRDDIRQVKQLYSTIRSVGFNPWLDVEDLYPGQSWEHEIRKAMKNADFILVFLSEISTSKIGYFNKEVKYAINIQEEKHPEDIFAIPVRLEDIIIPDPLNEIQCVDLFRENGIENLIKSIKTAWKRKHS
ncbi:hypothetical protein MHK_003320 [Candidatus Magnetomorum sp. HK-1]|nr:hypothetical protein MHK_003320 [Candidatus Magnetomorum sp. HK-1]